VGTQSRLFCVNLRHLRISFVHPQITQIYAEAGAKLRLAMGSDAEAKNDKCANNLSLEFLNMDADLPIRLVLVDPPDRVDFGIQHGSGSDYETLFVQQAKLADVTFDFTLSVADNRKDGLPNFKGPFAQGPPTSRFIYIDVGTYAGQKNTHWSRRMKVPLQGISWQLIKQTMNKPGHRLLAKIPGKGKDGGPNCATVKLVGDWQVIKE